MSFELYKCQADSEKFRNSNEKREIENRELNKAIRIRYL